MTTGVIQKSEEAFYKDAADYWSEIPATIDGMLGGFGFISQKDIHSSRILLKQIFNCKTPPERKYALDCGAGIGRITKFLLTELFEKVDMVEQNPIFLEQSKQYLGPKLMEHKIGNLYSVGLQNFKPEPQKYDIIWIQWVLGHLTDKHLVNFLKSCQNGLKPNGMIVVKENISSSEEIDIDDQDSSVTRPMSLLKLLFEKSNLDCYRLMKQTNFPKGLYTVFMFVLKPKKDAANSLIETGEVEKHGEKLQLESKISPDSHKEDVMELTQNNTMLNTEYTLQNVPPHICNTTGLTINNIATNIEGVSSDVAHTSQ